MSQSLGTSRGGTLQKLGRGGCGFSVFIRANAFFASTVAETANLQVFPAANNVNQKAYKRPNG
jgi:hypothetical protein